MTLHLIKWKDEKGCIQTFRLVDRVSASWRSKFGMILKLTTNQLNVWEDQYRGDANMCWARVMEQWLNGSSEADYPVTWKGLYSMLDDAEFSQIAQELRVAVNGAYASSDIQSDDEEELLDESSNESAEEIVTNDLFTEGFDAGSINTMEVNSSSLDDSCKKYKYRHKHRAPS